MDIQTWLAFVAASIALLLIPGPTVLADKLRAKIARPSVLAWFSRIGGGALVAMGVVTATFKRAQ